MKTLEELSFVDDFMFCKVLEDNEDLCKELLELILEKPIRRIESRTKQRNIDVAYDGKGIRLDVYVEDEAGTVYDIEMQATLDKYLPKRSRYYQGMIDLDLIEKGAKYKDLKKSYIIFICSSNPFAGKTLHKYTFENVCMEDKKLCLNDESIKIFLTPEGKADDISPKMKEFLNFISGEKPTNDFTRRIDESVAKEKLSKERKKEYMKLQILMQDEYAKGHAEGHAEGMEEGKLSILLGLKKNTGCSAEEALKMCDVPETEWPAYLDLLNEKKEQ